MGLTSTRPGPVLAVCLAVLGALTLALIASPRASAAPSWLPPIDLPVSAGQAAEQIEAALDPAGNAIVVWRRSDGAHRIVEASTRPAGGSFSNPVPLSAAGQSVDYLSLSGDPGGDAIAVWRRSDATSSAVQAAFYDATAPQLHSPSIPSTVTAGEPAAFGVTPFDAISSPSVAWSFGDGTAARSGSAVTHTFAAPGRYQLTVTATDAAGNATSTGSAITVEPGHPKAIAARRARLRGHKAILTLRCPVSGPCRGAAKLSAKRLTLGRRSFRIAAGKRLSLAIGLTPRAVRVIEATGRRGLLARLSGPGLKPTKVRLR
jgi:PKD domain